MDENDQMEIRAEVHGLPPAPNPLGSWDLTAELKPLRFRLASGPPLFFDQRLLTARCEYFQMPGSRSGQTSSWTCVYLYCTSSTAQGGGGSFKDRTL